MKKNGLIVPASSGGVMYRNICIVAMVCLLATSLASCGGGGGSSSGGGSGGGGTSSSSIVYSGSTSQATITPSNGQSLASSSLDGGSIGGIAASSGLNGAAIGVDRQPLSLKFSKVLKETVEGSILSSANSVNAAPMLAIQNKTSTTAGDCGGSLLIALNLDDQTGVFSGTMTYSSYCSFGSTTSGTISVSGSANLSTNQITQMTISTTSTSMSTGGTSYTFAGSLSVTTASITMNLIMRNDNTLEMFKVSNFIATASSGVGYRDVVLSGTFYSTNYGYITLSTPTPLRYSTGATVPSSGVMVATGANNSKVKLTAISSVQVQVDVDADGDNIYEVNIGTMNWTAL